MIIKSFLLKMSDEEFFEKMIEIVERLTKMNIYESSRILDGIYDLSKILLEGYENDDENGIKTLKDGLFLLFNVMYSKFGEDIPEIQCIIDEINIFIDY